MRRSRPDPAEPVTPPGVELRHSSDDGPDAWLEVVVDGFRASGRAGSALQRGVPADILLNAVRDIAAAGATGFDLLYTRAVVVKQPA